MEHLCYYNALRQVPAEAKREIQAGRLRGKTDINPVWRIKALTEQFGPCGVGWKYEVLRRELCSGAGGEIAAFVDIHLYIKTEDGWSAAIPGTGGSMFVANEKNGLYTSDECFKMALTDAISVSCKALGVAADVYWEKDSSKYGDTDQERPGRRAPGSGAVAVLCEVCGERIADYFDGQDTIPAAALAKRSRERYEKALCIDCGRKAKGT